MKKLFLLLPLVLMLVACGEESEVKKAVLATLIDPDSAKFGEFTLIGKKGACLTVNAKNRLGGYTGDSEAYLVKINDKWIVVRTDQEASHESCVQVLSKIIETQKDSLDSLEKQKETSESRTEQAERNDDKFIDIGTFKANLVPEGDGDRYLEVSMTVKLSNPDLREKIEALKPEIDSKINLLLSGKKASEISSPAEKEALSDEIKKIIEEVLRQGKKAEEGVASSGVTPSTTLHRSGVEDVLFTTFIFQ